MTRRSSLNGINIKEDYFEDFKEEYKIGIPFLMNEKNSKTEKTADLKAVLFSLHNYIKQGSREYYIRKIIALGGLDIDETEKYVDVYVKSMKEIYEFIKTQAEFNGRDLLKYIGDTLDE